MTCIPVLYTTTIITVNGEPLTTEQFFRLAQTSIRILQLSLLESSALPLTVYACVPKNSAFHCTCNTPPLHTSIEILIDLSRLWLSYSIML